MMNTIVIDDHNLFKEGFKLLLNTIPEYEFSFINGEFEHLINKNLETTPDMIFIDLNQRRLDQMSDFEKLRRIYKSSKIAVLSVFSNTKVVREAFQNGIDAYYLKNTDVKSIKQGLDEIMAGRTYMTEGLRLTPKIGHQPKAEVRQNLFNHHTPIKQKLTKRENEVLSLIIMAKSNKQIGDDLFISEQTVGVHKKNIMRKLGVHNTVALIRFAIDHNMA